jgi:hypothetical protein
MSAVQLKRKGSKTFRRSAANGGRRLLLSSKEATGVGQAGGTRSGRERWCLLERVLSRSLACLLVLQNSPLLAQEEQTVQPPALKVAVVAGQSAANNIRKRTAVEPVVLVSDERGGPVSGVMVLFTLPEAGASGVFPDGSKRAIVYTSPDGRAAARGLKPNSTPGEFQIVVDASFHGLTAHTTIQQTNVLPETAGGISSKLLVILAIAGGAAAAGVIAAGGGTNPSTNPSPPPTSSTSISAGTPTFGPPQ